jgi:hypothetical protein
MGCREGKVREERSAPAAIVLPEMGTTYTRTADRLARQEFEREQLAIKNPPPDPVAQQWYQWEMNWRKKIADADEKRRLAAEQWTRQQEAIEKRNQEIIQARSEPSVAEFLKWREEKRREANGTT